MLYLIIRLILDDNYENYSLLLMLFLFFQLQIFLYCYNVNACNVQKCTKYGKN